MTLQEHEIFELVNQGESLTLEFKSDIKSLPDRELIAAVVALANTEGGELLLGVEDNGEITGLHANHCHTEGIPALIANKTNPSISVRVEAIETRQGTIARILVPKSRQLVSTSDGLLQRRRLMANGKPEAVPFYPHEFLQRQSSLGLADPSALPIKELSIDNLNPIERHRIRDIIRKYGGDQSLLPLADNELDGALGLVITEEGRQYPTLAGLLLLGNETFLRRYIPAYEVAFQVLQGTSVVANEFFRKPLLQTFEEIELLFKARVNEQEIEIGLFRVAIPNYDRRAFREAFVNALVHRDYSRLGAAHVKLDDEGLTISSPGGFVEGVSLENLLTIAPRSRNPLLADIIKRIGLAERTGRGIDRIYEGMLRYGRPAPDYSMSDNFTVSVQLLNTEPDLDFLQMVLQQEDRIHGPMPIDSLIILSRLREERRLTTGDFVPSVQKPEAIVRAALEKLTEAGLIEAHGTGRGRAYTLSAKIYRHKGQKAAYIRQTGFEAIQQEQMILNYIDKHGSIKRAEVADLCRISPFQATRLLKKLVHEEKVLPQGLGKGTYYERKT
jgi:ATP-dependent DNA helicase RecG